MQCLSSLRLRAVLLLFCGGLLAACDSDDDIVSPDTDPNPANPSGPATIPTPAAYSFDSRFEDDVSSVSYGGQVVRNLLVNDIRKMIDALGKAGATAITEKDLLNRYEYDDGLNLPTLTTTGTTPAAETHYSAIATGKNLAGKISDEVLIGYGVTADELVRNYIRQVAMRAQDPAKLGTPAAYTTENGVHLSQMIQKVLLGAVVYSQATGHYLNIVLDQENEEAREDKPYSSMEHVWDEAYGYFGSARDFSLYTDDEISDGVLRDSNGDGSIDFSSEYNFTFAGYAGKRDKGGTDVDFTSDIFQAFLEGRTAIVNQASAAEIARRRDAIVHAWDELVAANAVHYINDVLADMAEVTGDQVAQKNNDDLNAHWAEAKAFVIAIQFNPFKALTDSQLETLHEYLGDAPPYSAPGSQKAADAVKDLEAARSLLQEAYGFSDANAKGW